MYYLYQANILYSLKIQIFEISCPIHQTGWSSSSESTRKSSNDRERLSCRYNRYTAVTVMHYIIEDIVKARILGDASCHLGSHACSELIHERQKLVGGDLLHSFLKHKITAAGYFTRLKVLILHLTEWCSFPFILRTVCVAH